MKQYDTGKELIDVEEILFYRLHRNLVDGALDLARSINYGHQQGFPDVKENLTRPPLYKLISDIDRSASMLEEELAAMFLQFKDSLMQLDAVTDDLIGIIIHSIGASRPSSQDERRKFLRKFNKFLRDNGPLWINDPEFIAAIKESVRRLERIETIQRAIDVKLEELINTYAGTNLIRKPDFWRGRYDEAINELIETSDHKSLGLWARDCVERVMPYFEAKHPEDKRPRRAIEALQAWIDTGVLETTVSVEAETSSCAAARDAGEGSPAWSSAWAAGKAVATVRAYQHAWGAAVFAQETIHRASSAEEADAAVAKERGWQYEHLVELSKKSYAE